MQILQKEDRFGRYYLAKKSLWINGKTCTVRQQRRMDPKEAGPRWRLTSSQMISILRHTEDWLYSWPEWRHAPLNFTPADRDTIQFFITGLEHVKPVFIYYNADEKDMVGQGTFEVNFPFNHFLSYRLKPSNDFVRIEL